MKKTPIIFKFDMAKVKALSYYLPKNGMSIESELQKRLEEIYNKEVPQEVKDYVNFQSGNTDSQDKNAQKQSDNNSDSSSKSDKKQTRTKKNEQTNEKALESVEPANPGMAMNMD